MKELRTCSVGVAKISWREHVAIEKGSLQRVQMICFFGTGEEGGGPSWTYRKGALLLGCKPLQGRRRRDIRHWLRCEGTGCARRLQRHRTEVSASTSVKICSCIRTAWMPGQNLKQLRFTWVLVLLYVATWSVHHVKSGWSSSQNLRPQLDFDWSSNQHVYV